MAKLSTTDRLTVARQELAATEAQAAEVAARRGTALINDDDKTATRLGVDIDHLRALARTHSDKIAMLLEKQKEEQEAAQAQEREELIRGIEGKLAERDKAVAELAKVVADYDCAFRKVVALGRECGTMWPWLNHDREAIMATPGAVLLALKAELFRVGGRPHAYGGGQENPESGLDLPGSQAPRLELRGLPSAVTPMTETFTAATRCASSILRSGKSTSGEMVQANVVAGVPVYARREKPPLTADEERLAELLPKLNLLSQRTSPEAQLEYEAILVEVSVLQTRINATNTDNETARNAAIAYLKETAA